MSDSSSKDAPVPAPVAGRGALTFAARAGLADKVPGARAWKRLNGLEKFVVYTRYSVFVSVATIALISAISMVSLTQIVDIPAGLWWAFAITGAVACVLSAISLDLQPGLNIRKRADARPWFRASLALCLALWALALVLNAVEALGDARYPFAIYSYLLLLLMCLAHAPWLPHPWWSIIAATAVTALVTIPLIGSTILVWLFMPLFVCIASQIALWSVSVIREADRARQLEGELSVADERLRIAQELHDTMGQHLAAMSLKTQVALALARRGDPRLEAELEELQQLTRVSTAEMRDVVHGYRTINLATEIASARDLLATADIAIEVTGDSFSVPAQHREISAWFVREGLTNVLRHASATRVALTLSEGAVIIENDGAGATIGPASGLATLRRRAESAGAQLTIHHAPPRFTARLAFTDVPPHAAQAGATPTATETPTPAPAPAPEEHP
ncbi:MAG: histidine kinase [Dermabacter sp.]|nr:histidine kinase [Dermabacter sp.]